jgi:hypothetical protein
MWGSIYGSSTTPVLLQPFRKSMGMIKPRAPTMKDIIFRNLNFIYY